MGSESFLSLVFEVEDMLGLLAPLWSSNSKCFALSTVSQPCRGRA